MLTLTGRGAGDFCRIQARALLDAFFMPSREAASAGGETPALGIQFARPASRADKWPLRHWFCQVTGFSPAGNRDKRGNRLPAAPPGVMVVRTAENIPAINPE